jgi:RHS repeat-associated protein
MTMIAIIEEWIPRATMVSRSLRLVLLGILLLTTGQIHAAQSITFYHNDVLGSPVAVSDINGDLCWREDYRPYGEKILNNDEKKSANPKCGLGDNQRGYTNHVHDKDTGLTYMQARYYDPAIGRFMGIDPVGVMLDNQVSFNRYAYGNNNPYRYTDPDGEIAAQVVGAIIGGLADAVGQVAVGINEGKTFGGAISSIDGKAVAVSMAVGALTGGYSAIQSAKAISGVISATKATINTATVGAVTSTTGTVATNALNGKTTSPQEAMLSGFGGFIGAGVGAKMANTQARELDKLFDRKGILSSVAKSTKSAINEKAVAAQVTGAQALGSLSISTGFGTATGILGRAGSGENASQPEGPEASH